VQELIARAFEAALSRVKASLGKHGTMYISGEARYAADSKEFADRSPIDITRIIGHFSSGGK
jgi:hypothetical protein